LYDLASRPATHRRLRKRDNLLTGERGRGWRRSQIIRQRESMVLYKLFNALL
jgi:hypothetical protein